MKILGWARCLDVFLIEGLMLATNTQTHTHTDTHRHTHPHRQKLCVSVVGFQGRAGVTTLVVPQNTASIICDIALIRPPSHLSADIKWLLEQNPQRVGGSVLLGSFFRMCTCEMLTESTSCSTLTSGFVPLKMSLYIYFLIFLCI